MAWAHTKSVGATGYRWQHQYDRIHDGTSTAQGTTLKSGYIDDPELEAFTPAFQYTSFKFISVTYHVPDASEIPPPEVSSMACYRVGVGFDWTGDVQVAGPPALIPALQTDVRPNTEVARCGRVQENDDLTVGCDGDKTIDKIEFASFGSTAGNCTVGFSEGLCPKTGKIGSANQSLVVVEKLASVKRCVVPATVSNFAGDGHSGQTCPHVKKSLAVRSTALAIHRALVYTLVLRRH